MEIVEENGKVIVQTAGWWKMQSQGAAGYTKNASVAAAIAAAVGETILIAATAIALVSEPQFDHQLDV